VGHDGLECLQPSRDRVHGVAVQGPALHRVAPVAQHQDTVRGEGAHSPGEGLVELVRLPEVPDLRQHHDVELAVRPLLRRTQAKTTTDAVQTYGLTYEPALFLALPDGTIQGTLAYTFDGAELDAELSRIVR